MCCLFTTLLLLGPRVAGALWWLVQPIRWQAAFNDSWLWPVLGLIFVPWLTLMYVHRRAARYQSASIGCGWASPWSLTSPATPAAATATASGSATATRPLLSGLIETAYSKGEAEDVCLPLCLRTPANSLGWVSQGRRRLHGHQEDRYDRCADGSGGCRYYFLGRTVARVHPRAAGHGDGHHHCDPAPARLVHEEGPEAGPGAHSDHPGSGRGVGPGCFHHHRVHRQAGRVLAELCRQLVDADLGGRTILDRVGIRAGRADRGISAGHSDFGYPGFHGGDVNCKQRSSRIFGGAESFVPVINGQSFADELD